MWRMLQKLSTSLNVRWQSMLVLMLSALTVLLPFTSSAEMKLGPYTFAQAPAKQLEIRTSLEDGLRSHRFISNVGGVAFEGVAVPNGKEQVDEVRLSYDPVKQDGERLTVTLCRGRVKRSLSVDVYDWQLFPIARFANSPYHACVTSQGKLTEEEQFHRHLRRGDWILNYHPAFEGTLLGLRLIQSDFITVIPEACDLPKENGRYLLGGGESSPNRGINRYRWDAFCEAATAIKKDYMAFVICDYQSPVKFEATKDNRLALYGEPVWCYVRCKMEADENAAKALEREMADRKRELERIKGNTNSVSPQLKFRREAEICQKLLTIYSEPYVEQRKAELVDKLSSGNGVQFLNDFSTKMTVLIRMHQNMNSQVYQSLRTTMQLAAFFRWAKQTSPGSLDTLIKQSERSDALMKHPTPSILVIAEEP
jgi:hypothetical protein